MVSPSASIRTDAANGLTKMIYDSDLKKILQEGKESYNELKLEKMIDLIKTLAHLDYEFQKRRKHDK